VNGVAELVIQDAQIGHTVFQVEEYADVVGDADGEAQAAVRNIGVGV
jgi:hypothetical protein